MTETENQQVEILQNKIDHHLEQVEHKNKELIDRVEREGNMLEDFLAPMGINSEGQVGVQFESNGVVRMKTKKGDTDELLTMHPNALTQTGTLMGIPSAYIKKLAHGEEQWERDLASHVLNKHNQNIDRRRMLIRSIGGEVRGVLSDKYRRLSTPIIYGEFFKACALHGARVIDATVSDLKSYVEVIVPRVLTVPSEGGNIYFVPGLQISNSDFGAASLQVKSFHINVACLNGMTRENIMKSIHLGKRLAEDITWSEETYKNDTQLQASQVSDIVTNSLSPDAIRKEARLIQTAAHTEVDMDNVLQKLPAMGALKAEVEDIKTIIMSGRAEDGIIGGSNLWKVTQGITAHARNLGGERKRDLDDLAGSLLSDLKIEA